MCRTFRWTRWPLAIAIVAALCILAPSTAFGQACQASGSIPIFPAAGGSCATGLLPGQNLDTVITLSNTSSTTPGPGVPVAAVWTGTITVTFPAGDVFVPVGGTGCVANDPGVASCAGAGNVVTITSTAGGVPLAAAASNVPIATLRTTVGGPAVPGCTTLLIAAGTPGGTGLTTADAACTPQVVGGAQGSAVYNEVECLVADTCPEATECASPTCIENACGTTNAPSTTHCGADDTECATNSCDGAGACVTTNTPSTTHCGADDTECATNSCDGAGACVTTNTPSTTHCGADDTECATNSCDGAGACVTTNVPSTTHCGADDTECATHSCDGAGECATTLQPATTPCNTELCQSCTGTSELCPTEDRCEPESCRTPGFWGTHAGTEKPNSTNITLEVLNSDGQVVICGQELDNTDLDSIFSAEEALCVHVKEGSQLQLARQLTAAALNCLVNGNLADCSLSPLFGQTFALCNTPEVCGGSKDAQTGCISALDCLNNGGHPGVDGSGDFLCATGTCSDNQELCTPGNRSNCENPDTAVCDPSANCHLEPLPGYEPPGPAGSSKKCNDANQNDCTIFSCL